VLLYVALGGGEQTDRNTTQNLKDTKNDKIFAEKKGQLGPRNSMFISL